MKTQRYGLLAGALILSVLLLSCGGPAPTKTPTPPPAAQPTRPEATRPAPGVTAAPQPTKVTATQAAPTTVPPVGAVRSYRIHSVELEGASDGPVRSEWAQDVILQPLAIHYEFTQKGQGMEIIIVGDSLWTRMTGGEWRETKQADMGQALAGVDQFAGGGVEVEEGVPLENDLSLLTGQRQLHIAEGSMTPAGEETVNGVACKKYTVDSTYFYTTTLPAPLNATAKVTLQDSGEIWVANQSGWTPFVVRAQLTEVSTTETPGGSNSVTIYIEQDVADINSPDITIQPPQ